MVPIMLAMLACGFGILANLHPKMEMSREPRGKIGKMIDQVTHQTMIYLKIAHNLKGRSKQSIDKSSYYI